MKNTFNDINILITIIYNIKNNVILNFYSIFFYFYIYYLFINKKFLHRSF